MSCVLAEHTISRCLLCTHKSDLIVDVQWHTDCLHFTHPQELLAIISVLLSFATI